MNRIVMASGNAGKLAELASILEPAGWELAAQSEYDVTDVEEDGLTFLENALKKARNACLHTGLPALADDSGLVVASLGGAPGIHSARYAGEPSNSEANIEKLLAALKGQPGGDRAAHFHCTIAWLRSAGDPDPIVATGRWPGYILETPRGSGGFGYDPVFAPQQRPGDPYDESATSAAELLPEQKNQVSHRGRALKSLLEQLSAGAR